VAEPISILVNFELVEVFPILANLLFTVARLQHLQAFRNLFLLDLVHSSHLFDEMLVNRLLELICEPVFGVANDRKGTEQFLLVVHVVVECNFLLSYLEVPEGADRALLLRDLVLFLQLHLLLLSQLNFLWVADSLQKVVLHH